MEKKSSTNGKKVILIIDDYFLIRRNHRLLLEKLGFEVVEASDGKTGIEKMEEMGPGYFSLIIVDLVMPEMSGAEFIVSCKKKFGEDSVPPIMVCSSSSEVPLVKKIASLGIDGYIVKPVDYKSLIEKLKSMFPDVGT